ncbi:MAG: hypothetical protein K2Q18_05640 [Bdellovibrionales bacterium]|nr:hypothetical protein [Bdellovibrionales bacterium]
MSSTKKNKPVSDDPVNTKIQRQFNLVFDKDKAKSPNDKKKENESGTINISEDYDLSPVKKEDTKTSMASTQAATISLDLATDSNIKHEPSSTSDEQGTMIASLMGENTKSAGLDFSLDFNLDGGESTVIASSDSLRDVKNAGTSSLDMPSNTATRDPSMGGFVLDELDLALNLSESTQKTVIANLDLLKGAHSSESDEVESKESTSATHKEIDLDTSSDSFDLASNSDNDVEGKAKIESTIKDIVRPKFENTAEINLGEMGGEDFGELNDEPLKEFRVDNNSSPETALDLGGSFDLDTSKEDALSGIDLGGGTNFDNDNGDTDIFSNESVGKESSEVASSEEFSLLSDDDDIFSDKTSFDSTDSESVDDAFEKTLSRSLTASMKSALAESGKKKPDAPVVKAKAESSFNPDMEDPLDSLFDSKVEDSFTSEVIAPKVSAITSSRREPALHSSHSTDDMPSGTLNTEDSMRFQATIRALREEREELLSKMKSFKTEAKELEQDNLTLKANLDEAKIEITILRKRHMVELEDLKYRLSMSEEKKALAEEKARHAEMRKEKLEQKVRIDFNQVKQREKELESKLELLSMDVDSQVQSRDHKILELRRKIDALEFNMENASIKEQKSLDDKRKLEDRLNKIMKTLRHSIKNLEDDIDHGSEDSDQQKDKN